MNEQDIENDTLSNDDMFNNDLEQLNVNVWFNKIESKLEYCLVKDNPKDGFMQYKMMVRQAEIIALAKGIIKKEELKNEVENEMEEEAKESDTNDIKEMRESMIKYGIILKRLLKAKNSDLNLSY